MPPIDRPRQPHADPTDFNHTRERDASRAQRRAANLEAAAEPAARAEAAEAAQAEVEANANLPGQENLDPSQSPTRRMQRLEQRRLNYGPVAAGADLRDPEEGGIEDFDRAQFSGAEGEEGGPISQESWEDSWNGRVFSPRSAGRAEQGQGQEPANFGSPEWNRYMDEVGEHQGARQQSQQQGGQRLSYKELRAKILNQLISCGSLDALIQFFARKWNKSERNVIRMRLKQQEKLLIMKGAAIRNLGESLPRTSTTKDPTLQAAATDRQARRTHADNMTQQLINSIRDQKTAIDQSIQESVRNISRNSQFVDTVGDIEDQMWQRILK